MYSLNYDDGQAVTHVDAFGDETPSCGFASDDDGYTVVPALVTCRDCLATAIPSP